MNPCCNPKKEIYNQEAKQTILFVLKRNMSNKEMAEQFQEKIHIVVKKLGTIKYHFER